MSKFELGNVVRLKSGSPNMTITKINDLGFCNLSYYREIDKILAEEQNIHTSCLVKIDNAKSKEYDN